MNSDKRKDKVQRAHTIQNTQNVHPIREFIVVTQNGGSASSGFQLLDFVISEAGRLLRKIQA